MFIKYQHLEKLHTEETDGIEVGTSYVFPKIDGTNGSIWYDKAYFKLAAGSRNRKLSLDADNAGFLEAMSHSKAHKILVVSHPHLIFYGEWLVPHSLKTYREDAWRKFYIFDVYNRGSEKYVPYDEYKPILDEYEVEYIAPIAIIKNGNYETYQECLNRNFFLIDDGKGNGEGIVIKNYAYENKYGRQTWAKLITNAFKENHHKEMGAPLVGGEIIEDKIISKFVDKHLVDKVHAKIVNEMNGWSSKYIPRLLHTVYYDLITEETWNILKEFKNPKIDFRTLNNLCTQRIKELKPEVF